MKRKYLIYCFVLVMVALTSCGKEKSSSILPSGIISPETKEAESDTSFENIEIDEKYLQERYSGKEILTWVYAEAENLSEKERKEYNNPIGMKYITNTQIIRLNDYLVSQGKNYVICFKKLSGGDDFADEIKEMSENGQSPEFVFAEWYLDELEKPSFSSLAYDLIGKGLLEELSQYADNVLQDYMKTLPENAVELSSMNGKFYGYNEGIGYIERSFDWYVNTDLAEEYHIDIDAIGKGGYTEWMEACDKIYEGEKAKGSKNFLIYEADTLKPLYEHNIAGYIGKIDRTSDIEITALGVTLNGDKVENYYKIDHVKQAFREVYENKKKGYFDYLNEIEEDNRWNANLFISNFYGECVEGTEMNEAEPWAQDFPKLKNVKKLTWTDCGVKRTEMREFYAVNGICSKSDKKELALEAYNFLHSDMEAANIIKFPEYDGSGRDYKITEDEYDRFFDREENYEKYDRRGCKLANPLVANAFSDKNSVEKCRENIENLKFNKNYIDKYYDFTPVKKQIKAIAKVEKKYIGEDYDGKVFQGDFDVMWEEFMKELDNAGMQRVLDYINEK